jgi:mRNA-degrading endonuclease RelE of RelBE toxin-antitoxin system
MAYAVYTTDSFEKKIEKISNSDKERIQKLFLQLKENPYIGKQLKIPFFREKRIYYLVYDDLNSVLVVAFGGKKGQQETIDNVIKALPEFKAYLERSFKK